MVKSRVWAKILMSTYGHPISCCPTASPNERGLVPDPRRISAAHAIDAQVDPRLLVRLRLGGGTRPKILEALATGVAVVSSAVRAAGIETVSGTDILIADSPDDPVDAIGMLREQPGCRYDLIERARELLVWRYTIGVSSARARIRFTKRP